VRDHGIGIAVADVERIFGRLERAVSSRNFGGLGLGLYISRQIVEAHGGHHRRHQHARRRPPPSRFELPVELPVAT
jgi:signal transduction histidine kinase